MSKCQNQKLNGVKTSVVIYGLYDPITHELRYVGKTSVTLDLRLKRHLRDNHITHKVAWLRKLRKFGVVPIIREIELCTDENWQETERRVIQDSRNKGCRLTNLESGGRGGHTVGESVKEKMRNSQLIRYQMLRRNNGGVAATLRTRALLSKNATGHSWNRGWKHTTTAKVVISSKAVIRELRLKPMKLGISTITTEGRCRVSAARKQSSKLFLVTDVQWRNLSVRQIAEMCRCTENNVRTYRWRNKRTPVVTREENES
jgi:hypothetical protein